MSLTTGAEPQTSRVSIKINDRRVDAPLGSTILDSKAATTDAGILLAERSNVTLIGFARGDRFTVYSHPERIRGLS